MPEEDDESISYIHEDDFESRLSPMGSENGKEKVGERKRRPFRSSDQI